MRQSELHGDVQSGYSIPPFDRLIGAQHKNGPKVDDAALEKFDYLLEYLADPPVLRHLRWWRATIREAFIDAKAMSQTISRKGRRAKARRNPQRPYVERPCVWTKRWSVLRGDMQGQHHVSA